LTADQACNVLYALLVEHADQEGRDALDAALARPLDVTAEQQQAAVDRWTREVLRG